MATLSLCMIVKNEAAHLDRCLDSIRPLVDEIVVADTGSTDETLDIATHRADRLLSFPGATTSRPLGTSLSIRRAAIGCCRSTPTKTIAQRDHARIRAALHNPSVDAVESIHRHYLVDGIVVGWKPGPGGYEEGLAYQGYFDVPCRRLFRRLTRLRWRNPVHEELASMDSARPLRASADRWVIHHFGKTDDPARLAAKAEMYLRLGLQKAAELPDDALAQYEIGIQLQELQRWDEALAAFRRTATIEPGFRQTDLYIAICLTKLGKLDGALSALTRARRSTPSSAAEILLEEGNLYLAMQDPGEGRTCLPSRAHAHAVACAGCLQPCPDRAADRGSRRGAHLAGSGAEGRGIQRRREAPFERRFATKPATGWARWRTLPW